MKFRPYPWQQVAVDYAVNWFRNANPGDKILMAAPTGCGKSVIELLVKEQLPGSWLISPRSEIIDGFCDKLEYTGDPLDIGFATPLMLRNRLLAGAVSYPTQLLVDEGHHSEAETYQQLDLLSGLVASAAYTATPYRGSPASTKALRERWGDPLWLITYEEAAAEGYIKIPIFTTLPLVDDDVVEVSGGEFKVTSLEGATLDRLGDLAEHSRMWHDGTSWTLSTMYAVPSTACAVRLQQELNARGLPSVCIVAATPKKERWNIFDAVVARHFALIHINVVNEGVDVPIRRLIDLAPTLSPVRWVQQIGRITRPWDGISEYITTNRNLMRHAYAMQGVVPLSAVADSEKAFPETTRVHVRALGLEAIGRFKSAGVKLSSGVTLHMYNLSAPAGNGIFVSYACLVHPTQDPVWVSKVNQKDGETMKYGAWIVCEAPEGLKGFASAPPSELSPKQKAWWGRSAAGMGIDPSQEVDRKRFAILPVMMDTGVRFWS